jgi:hypothetical protein
MLRKLALYPSQSQEMQIRIFPTRIPGSSPIWSRCGSVSFAASVIDPFSPESWPYLELKGEREVPVRASKARISAGSLEPTLR